MIALLLKLPFPHMATPPLISLLLPLLLLVPGEAPSLIPHRPIFLYHLQRESLILRAHLKVMTTAIINSATTGPITAKPLEQRNCCMPIAITMATHLQALFVPVATTKVNPNLDSQEDTNWISLRRRNGPTREFDKEEAETNIRYGRVSQRVP